MNVKTLKDFEKETKIIDEIETEREPNENLARVLLVEESQLWNNIRHGAYGWVQIDSERKDRLIYYIYYK